MRLTVTRGKRRRGWWVEIPLYLPLRKGDDPLFKTYCPPISLPHPKLHTTALSSHVLPPTTVCFSHPSPSPGSPADKSAKNPSHSPFTKGRRPFVQGVFSPFAKGGLKGDFQRGAGWEKIRKGVVGANATLGRPLKTSGCLPVLDGPGPD